MRTAFANDPDLRRTFNQLSLGNSGRAKVTYQAKYVTAPVTLESNIQKMVSDWKKESRHAFIVPSVIN